MDDLPTLTDVAIRARVGDASYQRGLAYFRDGAIFSARRQGATLSAHCEGSQAASYRVEATFDAEGLASAHCSCPVGGGYCKHVAALLLTWLARPGDFTLVEELDAALERRSKAELIALVKQMLRQEPELESLLETPLPTPGQPPVTVDPEIYRRRAEAAFRGDHYDDYGAASSIAEDLQPTIQIGQGFLAQEAYAAAATVFEAVTSVVLEHIDTIDDEEGELYGVLADCVEGMGNCLAAELDARQRETLLRALFAVYREDIEGGGHDYGAGAADLLLEQTTPEERRTIAELVRAALPQGNDWSSGWRSRTYGGFLLALERDALDDETYLRICRETGRTADLVDRLLTLGRVEEATTAAEGAGDYDLLGLADQFVTHAQGELAERLVRDRSRQSQDLRLLAWLATRYEARGDLAAAFDAHLRLFHARPDLAGYRELRRLGEPLRRWTPTRPALLSFLTEEKLYHLLVEIFLDEGDVDQALTTLPKATPSYYTYGGSDLTLRVAAAAEAERPAAALALYRQRAERLIDARGRGNYTEAARLLGNVRDLHLRLGERDAWAAYIAALRDKNRALRALKDELTAAGI